MKDSIRKSNILDLFFYNDEEYIIGQSFIDSVTTSDCFLNILKTSVDINSVNDITSVNVKYPYTTCIREYQCLRINGRV